MIVFYGEKPSTLTNGISLSNQLMYGILNNKQKVIWIEEFGSRNLLKEFISILMIFKIIIFNNKIKYFYLVLPTSTLGLLRIYLIFFFSLKINKNLKFLFHIHRSDLIKKNENKRLKYIILNLFQKKIHALKSIFVISDKLKDDLKIFFKNKIRIIVKKNNFLPHFRLNPINDFSSKKKIKLIYLSNISKNKGISDLCNKLSKKKYASSFDLDIFGKTIDNYSKNFFKNRKFENITLKGFLKNSQKKFDILRQYDALILPSKNEGDPICILEAMSLGLPVLCYDVGYISETLGENYKLYLDKNSLEKILYKLKNGRYRKKISFYLRERYKLRLYQEKNLNNLINNYLLD